MNSVMEWMDGYAVGIEEVDNDHRALIELINDLYAALSSGSSDEDIVGFLTEVHTSVAAHFTAEERIMRSSAYAEYDAHQRDHARLLDEILGMIDDYSEVYSLAPELLATRLENWFMAHFRTHDARLHDMT